MATLRMDKHKRKILKRDKTFFICFVAPAFILITVFMFLPILFSFGISLTKWNGATKPVFIQLENYIQMLQEQNYWQSVKNSGVLIILVLLFKIPLGCILAFVIMKVKKGYKIFRSIYFFPVIIAPLVIGLLFKLMYDGNFGVINSILKSVGLSSLIRNWLSDTHTVLYAVSIPQVYQYIGTFFLIFLAAFLALPTEVLESAKIDGASAVRTLISIMLPMIKPVIQACLILGITGALKDFDHPWVITGGGPGYDSSFLAVYMFRESFVSYKFGYGSAVTISIIFYALLITFILKKLLNTNEMYETKGAKK